MPSYILIALVDHEKGVIKSRSHLLHEYPRCRLLCCWLIGGVFERMWI